MVIGIISFLGVGLQYSARYLTRGSGDTSPITGEIFVTSGACSAVPWTVSSAWRLKIYNFLFARPCRLRGVVIKESDDVSCNP